MSECTIDEFATQPADDECRYRERAREHTVAGTALGVASAGSLAVFGTFACPICVVAAPALIGSGIWNHKKSKQQDGPDDD